MGSKNYELSVRSVYQWCRRGSDYGDPKYRALLVNAAGVFLGLITALIINEATRSSFPSVFILPMLTVAYAVYFYAYYRTKHLKRDVRIKFVEMNYSFDFPNNQLIVKNKNFENPVPLFAADGFHQVSTRGNKLFLTGRPNMDLILILEREKTSYYAPAYAYRDFSVELLVDNASVIEEVSRAFERAYGSCAGGNANV